MRILHEKKKGKGKKKEETQEKEKAIDYLYFPLYLCTLFNLCIQLGPKEKMAQSFEHRFDQAKGEKKKGKKGGKKERGEWR